MNFIIRKLSVGTSQFSLECVSLKIRKKIAIKNFMKFIGICTQNKICSIDTASYYCHKEKKIEKILSHYNKKFDLTSKIPSLK